MHKHRLDKLAKLTKGAALVGIGALFACQGEKHINGPAPAIDSGATEPIHTNAPYEVFTDASEAPSAAPTAPSASAALTSTSPPPNQHPTNMPHINAPPRPFPHTINTVTAEPK